MWKQNESNLMISEISEKKENYSYIVFSLFEEFSRI